MGSLLPEPAIFALFLSAGLALNFTPGPDMLYVLARSTAGRREGMLSALGISTGRLIHTLAAMVGISALLAASPVAMRFLQGAGALYLIYLGGRQILTSRATRRDGGGGIGASDTLEATREGLGAIYFQGVATNTLNPKVGLFFLAFLPQFVDPERGSAALQFFLLGCIFNLTGTGLHLVLAVLGGGLAVKLQGRPRFFLWQRRISGGVLLVLGVWLAIRL